MSSNPNAALVAYLKKIPLFADLADEECVDIVRTFATEKVEAGKDLCKENDPGEAMYVVEKGSLRVHKRTLQGIEQEIARLAAGAIVGEMALLDGQPRSATVSAVETSSLYRVDRVAFTTLRANLRPAAFKVIRTLARTLCARLREINGSIEEFWADPERSLAQMKERQAKIAAEVKARMMQRAAAVQPGVARAVLPGRAAPPPMTKSFRPGDPPAALAAFLAEVPLLRGLSAKELDVLAQLVKPRVVADGAIVCNEGDAGDQFDIVAAGGVHVVKEMKKTGFKKTLATSGAGAVFGEVSLIDGKKRSATVYAMGETCLLVCGRAEFEQLFRASSPFAFKFVERIAVDLSRRVREADDLFTSIYSRVGETVTELEAQLLEIQGSLEGGAWPTDTATLLKLVGYKDV